MERLNDVTIYVNIKDGELEDVELEGKVRHVLHALGLLACMIADSTETTPSNVVEAIAENVREVEKIVAAENILSNLIN